MTGIDYEKSVVALVCWKQMRGELYRGMSSLAMVLRNRARANWYEGSIYINAVALANEEGLWGGDVPDSREPQFQSLLQAIDGIFADTLPDKTDGAMYFTHKSSAEGIAGQVTLEVGQYVFFREVR